MIPVKVWLVWEERRFSVEEAPMGKDGGTHLLGGSWDSRCKVNQKTKFSFVVYLYCSGVQLVFV